MSPKLLKQAKSILSRKRVTPRIREALQQALNDMELNHHSTSDNGLVEPIPGIAVDSTPVYLKDLPFTPQTKITDRADGLIPMGAVVVNAAIVQYWLSIPAGEEPKQVFVNLTDIGRAGDSASLRVVYPLINGVGEDESILDGGSQIVSMAQEVAVRLGIGWDPDSCIYMQSANGQSEKSLGLARNVPFRFTDMTVYLQVHIIQTSAYKVLLGRPFDILTISNIANHADGGQLLTLTDPSTRKRVVVPTFARGETRLLKKARDASTEIHDSEEANQNFQNSRN
jgi:hypothetical protein